MVSLRLWRLENAAFHLWDSALVCWLAGEITEAELMGSESRVVVAVRFVHEILRN